MTMKCTEPERWMITPGSDASEDDVERYLSHIDECAFHAEIEERAVERMHTVAAVAMSVPMGGSLISRGKEAARIRESLNTLGILRRNAYTGKTIFKPAAVVVTLIAAVLLVTIFLRWTRQPTHIAQQGPDERSSGANVESATPSGPEPSGPSSPNVNSNSAASPDQRRALPSQPIPRRKQSRSAPVTGDAGTGQEATSLVSVKRVYVSFVGSEEKDRQLRDALVDSLQKSKRFIVVDSEGQADAVLKSEQTRSTEVTVRLVNKNQKFLWQKSAPTSIENVASEIVKDLLSDVEKLERMRADPQQ